MTSRLLAGLVAVAVSTTASTARAESSWFDPKLGCGPVGAFARSGRAADLPGCTGHLPKDAPQVELAMRELKAKLVDAEELLAKNKLDKLDALLAEVDQGLGKTLPVHPEMPDRWEQAQRVYREAIGVLRDRRKLAPLLDGLRAAHAHALDADRARNRKEIEGGPAEAEVAATACSAVFAELHKLGVDPALPVELERKAAPRRLQDAAGECERIRHSAEALRRAQDESLRQRRAQWRGVLKGARRKIFDAHPRLLPQFDGGPERWRAIATASVWKYVTPTGTEIYTWKGNKLLRTDTGK